VASSSQSPHHTISPPVDVGFEDINFLTTKKATARKIVYGAFEEIKNKSKKFKMKRRNDLFMVITKEQEIKNTLKAKGKLIKIDKEGLHIFGKNKKQEVIEVLSLDDFNIFIGSEISITVAESTKQDITIDTENDDEDGDNGTEDDE